MLKQPAMPLRQQPMWQIDTNHPEQGIHEVTASLFRTDCGGFQWETTGHWPAIFPASEDGRLLDYRDVAQWIYATPQVAASICADILRKRITEDQNRLASLTARWLAPFQGA
jgi:hypothetical protein